VWFDPGENARPGLEFSESLFGVVEETAGLHVVVVDDVADLSGLTLVEESGIISFQEVD
jgi:hypothetical protein